MIYDYYLIIKINCLILTPKNNFVHLDRSYSKPAIACDKFQLLINFLEFSRCDVQFQLEYLIL